MTAKWEVRPTTDEVDGYNGYFIYRNGIEVLEVHGPRRDWRESYLNELISTANGTPVSDRSQVGWMGDIGGNPYGPFDQ